MGGPSLKRMELTKKIRNLQKEWQIAKEKGKFKLNQNNKKKLSYLRLFSTKLRKTRKKILSLTPSKINPTFNSKKLRKRKSQSLLLRNDFKRQSDKFRSIAH